MAKALTAQQEKFIQKYLECGNASEAYRCAYNAINMATETIHRKAHDVLNNGKVTARLAKLQQRTEKCSELSRAEVVKMLSDAIMADVTEYVTPDGNIRVKEIKRMPIEKLSRLCGWDAPVKSDVNLTANVDLQKIKDTTTPEEIAILAAFGKRSLPL
jgi:phage terminase small subunit